MSRLSRSRITYECVRAYNKAARAPVHSKQPPRVQHGSKHEQPVAAVVAAAVEKERKGKSEMKRCVEEGQ